MNVVTQKTVAITGGTGLIGSALNVHLSQNGYLVKILKRGFTYEDIVGSDIIINLAGSTINKRWSKRAVKEIYDSRIITTRKVVEYIKNTTTKRPSLLISASAIGIYPSSDGKKDSSQISYDEYSTERGKGFLTEVCESWEQEAMGASYLTRVVITRFGVVLSQMGGALPKMSLPFKLGVAGTIGSGSQPFSWINLEDLTSAIAFLIEREDLSGVFNLTSPNPITNSQLTQILARRYKSPIKMTIPSFVFKAAYGEAAILFTEGQKVIPKRLMENGFTSFKFPTWFV